MAGYFVTGCQMPALHCVTVLLRQTVEGRRRTSLEGGGRELRSDMFGWRAVYGDLNCGSTFPLANKSICGVIAGRSFRSSVGCGKQHIPHRSQLVRFVNSPHTTIASQC